MTFILFLNVRTWKTFSITSTSFIKILSLLWRKRVMENLRFLDTIESEYWKDLCIDLYIGSLSILTNTYTTSLTASCKESVVSSLFNRVYSIITNKDHLYKESARIKQVLKENGYQESIISKIFITITYNHSKKRKPQISKRKISGSV